MSVASDADGGGGGDTSSVTASVVSDTDGGGGDDTSIVAASVVSETVSSEPYNEKFRCGMCHASLHGLARKYCNEPETIFICPFCSTNQKFGTDNGVYFTVMADDDDDDDDEYVKVKAKSLDEVEIGDCVKIEFRKPKPAEYVWVVNVQKSGEKKDRARTRARSRAQIIFTVVFDTASETFYEFSTHENKITHATRPNWDEEQRITGKIEVKTSIQDLEETERNWCIDLTSGGHPSDEEVIHKYQTIITYGHFAEYLAPRKWLSADIINFYMQVCMFSCFPHVLLTTSSYIVRCWWNRYPLPGIPLQRCRRFLRTQLPRNSQRPQVGIRTSSITNASHGGQNTCLGHCGDTG